MRNMHSPRPLFVRMHSLSAPLPLTLPPSPPSLPSSHPAPFRPVDGVRRFILEQVDIKIFLQANFPIGVGVVVNHHVLRVLLRLQLEAFAVALMVCEALLALGVRGVGAEGRACVPGGVAEGRACVTKDPSKKMQILTRCRYRHPAAPMVQVTYNCLSTRSGHTCLLGLNSNKQYICLSGHIYLPCLAPSQ
jgi:hypothetical protein